MSTSSVLPPENRPAPGENSSGAAIDRRSRGRTWFLAFTGAITLIASVAVWLAYQWPPALVISFVTAICGLTKALIDLHLVFEKREVTANPKTTRRRRKRMLTPVVSASLLLGMAIGYFGLPPLIDAGWQPSADVSVPANVNADQPAVVNWRNIPDDEDIRVFVRAKGSSINFIQPCRGRGRRGSMLCELEMGGSEAAGSFEIRVVRVAHNLSEGIANSPPEGAYLSTWPEGAQVLVAKTVNRNGKDSL
jgi:hypothetical protein